VNSLPKTVTRQRRDCDLNPGPSAHESSTLTTRLPSYLCRKVPDLRHSAVKRQYTDVGWIFKLLARCNSFFYLGRKIVNFNDFYSLNDFFVSDFPNCTFLQSCSAKVYFIFFASLHNARIHDASFTSARDSIPV